MDLDAAQDAYQAWLRVRSLAVEAARSYLARSDDERRRELEGLLAAEAKQRAEFEALVSNLQ